jgi:hypothetical protein
MRHGRQRLLPRFGVIKTGLAVSCQTKNHELHTLLPWNWRQPSTIAAA